MIKKLFLIIVLISLGTTKVLSQNALLQDFKCESFELKYPIFWKVDSSGTRYFFSYNAKLGDITVSSYENQKFSENEIKDLLLELKKQKEKDPDIKLSNVNGTITCLYKYTSNKVNYFVKAIQNDKKMFLISLNWRQDSWEDFKDVLLESFESLKIN